MQYAAGGSNEHIDQHCQFDCRPSVLNKYPVGDRSNCPLILDPPMNGGFPTIASNPPRSMNTSGNSNGQWNGLRASRLLQSLFRLSLKLLDRQVLEVVLDVGEGLLQPFFPVGVGGRFPAGGQQEIGGVGEPLGLLFGILEHQGLALDIGGAVVGHLGDLPAQNPHGIEPLLDGIGEHGHVRPVAIEREAGQLVRVGDARPANRPSGWRGRGT